VPKVDAKVEFKANAKTEKAKPVERPVLTGRPPLEVAEPEVKRKCIEPNQLALSKA
jgi:hypothetical protein